MSCCRTQIVFLFFFLADLPTSLAHNTFFLPSDAFFHTLLTDEKAQSLLNQQNHLFTYTRPKEFPGSFSGYAGFETLKFTSMPPGLRNGLRRVYYEVRQETPKEIKSLLDGEGKVQWEYESNALHLLFYNRGFDLEQFKPFVKYNEAWKEETALFGHDISQVRLERFVPDWDGSEWRDASLVSGLDVKAPAVPRKHNKAKITSPLEINGSLVALVFKPKDFRRYKNGQSGARCYLVTESKTLEYRYKHGQWRKVD